MNGGDSYTKRGEQVLAVNHVPTCEDMFDWFRDATSKPEVQKYLDAHPDYRQLFVDWPEKLNAAVENRIRQRAEEIYNQRLSAGIDGDEQADWFQAQKQLCEEWNALN